MNDAATSLHPPSCCCSDADLVRMREEATRDPAALERACWLGEDSVTPVQLAVRSGHPACLALLVQLGAGVTRQYGFAGDALEAAITFDQPDMACLLIEKYGLRPSNCRFAYINCDPSAMYLLRATMEGSPQMVQILLDAGAATENTEYLRDPVENVYPTPIMNAIMYERPENLKVLLLNGAITDFKSENFPLLSQEHLDFLSLPIRLALSFGNNLDKKIEMLHILYEFGVHLRQRTSTDHDVLCVLEDDACRREMMDLLGVRHYGTMEQPPEMSPDQRAQLARHVRRLVSSPLSLKAQCRLAVRRTRQLDVAELPRELTSYLLFQT